MHIASSPAVSLLFRRALALALFTASLAPLSAQTAPASGNTTSSTPVATAAKDDSLGLVLEGVYEHIFSSNLKNGGSGSMSVNRYAIGGQETKNWAADHLTFAAAYAYLNYEFSGTPAPFGNVQKLGVNFLYMHDFDSNWGAFGFLSSGLSAETEASLSKGGQISLAAGPTYKFSEDLSVYAGPMFYSRLEDSATWTLMAQVKWAFLPQWEVRAYAGINNGATVTYDVFGDKATVVDGSLEYNSRWFRTRDIPAGKQAVNESDAQLKLGVRQALSQNFFVRGYVSYVFSREYQFHVNGNSANSFDVDASWGLGLEVGAAF